MSVRGVCLVLVVVAVTVPLVMTSSGPPPIATSASLEECESVAAQRRALAKDIVHLSDQMFTPGRSACTDLSELYRLRKAHFIAETNAREICSTSLLAKSTCDTQCQEDDLVRLASVKMLYCAKES